MTAAIISNLPKQEENQAPPQEVVQEQNPDSYPAYRSIFDMYPQMRSRSRPLMFLGFDSRLATDNHAHIFSPLTSSYSTSTTTVSTISSSLSLTRSRSSSASSVRSHGVTVPIPLPDLQPLKLAVTSKLLDPSKRVCQYEIPGGGVCRDEGCEDIHPSRIVGGSSSGGHTSFRGVEPSGA